MSVHKGKLYMANGRVGTQINGPGGEQFRIESFLGNGAFGEVYKVIGETSGTVAAVKMVPQNKLNDPATLSARSIDNEVRMHMKQIHHPNVVTVLHVDPGTDPDIGPYVMMEFVSGGNLQDLLNDRSARSAQFSLDEALSLMRGIALGAQAVNEHLVHRDIKPDNILLDSSGGTPRPRITDFGIAKVIAEATRPETFKGTQMWWYKAPESWRMEKNTPKMDVYSTGLVFYQILTLEHPLMRHLSDPFDYDRWREVHLTVLCADVCDKRTDVPMQLAKLLLRMVDKSPGNRPDWDEIIRGLSLSPPSAPSPSVDPRVIAAMRGKAEEHFRGQQAQTAAELARTREAERKAAMRQEYSESGKRLLTTFDEIIDELNRQETGYHIKMEGQGTLSRKYTLLNGRALVCQIFDYHPAEGRYGRFLGGGYMGVSGGLSANLILFGIPDDIASGNWQAVEATLSGILMNNRERRYQEAGVPAETMNFAEWGADWARDFPQYFGFTDASSFYDNFKQRGMTAYNFNIRPGGSTRSV
jgi:eukaryotic-like serine/threonine-protein kinase